MRAWVVAIVLAGGCGPGSHEGESIDVDVSWSEALDQVALIVAERDVMGAGPVTPGMLAAGLVAPASAVVRSSHSETEDVSTADRGHRFSLFALFGFTERIDLLALGYRRDPTTGALALVAAGTVTAPRGISVQVALPISGAQVSSLEVWSAAGNTCARVRDAAPVRYFVAPGDTDCDGIPTDSDCDDLRFCDPAATTPAGRAGCTTARCQPCAITGPGDACALGSQAVCRDVRGKPRSFTCGAAAECGAATCLPASACQLTCPVSWPNTDPTLCWADAWRRGLQAADALQCALPTTRVQSGSKACPGGSVVELALPYTGCAKPRFLYRPNHPELTATVVAPCTLRLSQATTEFVGPEPVVVTLDTATSSASVRVVLTPSDGTCSAVGTCSPVTATASCQL